MSPYIRVKVSKELVTAKKFENKKNNFPRNDSFSVMRPLKLFFLFLDLVKIFDNKNYFFFHKSLLLKKLYLQHIYLSNFYFLRNFQQLYLILFSSSKS